MTEQGGFTGDPGAHTPAEPVTGDVFPCATCGERLPQPGRLRCQECLDDDWVRQRAKDPPWYERRHSDHRHG